MCVVSARPRVVGIVLFLSVVVAPAHAGAAAPSPSGVGPVILYGSNWAGPSEIFAVNPAGRAPIAQLTFDTPPGCLGAPACGASHPLPSPDGRHVLYHSSREASRGSRSARLSKKRRQAANASARLPVRSLSRPTSGRSCDATQPASSSRTA